MFTEEINYTIILILFPIVSHSIYQWQIWSRNSDGSVDCVPVVWGVEYMYNFFVVIIGL